MRWHDMPAHVRDGVEAVVGAEISSVTDLDGGFSPGPAARCELDDGRVVFVKAAGTALNPIAPRLHRREGEVLRRLPAEAPAPGLIGVHDDGDWVALVIEWIDGRMPQAPLPTDDVDRVLGLVDRLSGFAGGSELQPFFAAHTGLTGHWQRLLDDVSASTAGASMSLDRWTLTNLERLAALEADIHEAAAGDRLVHMDLRSDNVLLAQSGPEHDIIVDWPGASIGAPWLDLVGMLPSLELDGGPRCDVGFARLWSGTGRDPDPHAVNVVLATFAGYFTRMSLRTPPPGLPTLRPFQAAQARIARRWLAERFD